MSQDAHWTIKDLRAADARRLEDEVSQLVTGPTTVTVRLPAAGVRLLTELAESEWDRRQAELQAHRIKVGQQR